MKTELFTVWYNLRKGPTYHKSLADAIKAANNYLKKYPHSEATINIYRYSPGHKDSSIYGDHHMGAVYYANVDGKRQIVYSSARGKYARNQYSIINKNGSIGKKGLRKEYLYDRDGLIYNSRMFTR